MTPEARVHLVAQQYDGEDGEGRRLAEATIRRLAWRLRRGGKECDRCGETKPVSAFGLHSREPDGLRRECRSCVASYDLARRGRDAG